MRILMITTAPEGTLGDPSICKKMIDVIHKEYPESDIEINVYDIPLGDAAVAKVENLFANPLGRFSSKFIHHSKICYFNREDPNEVKMASEIYGKYDAVIAFPYHLMGSPALSRIQDVSKLLIPISNYNTDFSYEEDMGRRIPYNINYMKLGIGEDSKGIFLPKFVESSFKAGQYTKDMIQQKLKNEDKSVLDFIMPNTSKEYFDKNDLYFGYHNKLPESDGSVFQIKDYVTLCLNNSDKNNVDIMLNVESDNKKVSSTCKISKILKGINQDEYKVEYWSKSKSGEMVKKLETDTSPSSKKKTCRIINPFPLAHGSFITFLSLSSPLTVQTGNSSIFEAISLGKIPIYQVTKWSKKFNEALNEYVKNKLGENSTYYQFYDMINTKGFDIQSIEAFFNQHQHEMKEEIEKLGKIIEADEKINLEKSLIGALKEWNLPSQEPREDLFSKLKLTDNEKAHAGEIYKNEKIRKACNFIVSKVVEKDQKEFTSLVQQGLFEKCPEASEKAINQLFEAIENKREESAQIIHAMENIIEKFLSIPNLSQIFFMISYDRHELKWMEDPIPSNQAKVDILYTVITNAIDSSIQNRDVKRLKRINKALLNLKEALEKEMSQLPEELADFYKKNNNIENYKWSWDGPINRANIENFNNFISLKSCINNAKDKVERHLAQRGEIASPILSLSQRKTIPSRVSDEKPPRKIARSSPGKKHK